MLGLPHHKLLGRFHVVEDETRIALLVLHRCHVAEVGGDEDQLLTSGALGLSTLVFLSTFGFDGLTTLVASIDDLAGRRQHLLGIVLSLPLVLLKKLGYVSHTRKCLTNRNK